MIITNIEIINREGFFDGNQEAIIDLKLNLEELKEIEKAVKPKNIKEKLKLQKIINGAEAMLAAKPYL